MNYTNYHSHTPFCDGRSTPEEMIESALHKGFFSWAFTSHAPVPFKTVWNMKAEDMEAYLNTISNLKAVYKDKLAIYTGLEMDYLPSIGWGYTDKTVIDALELKIGSIHFAGNFDNGEFWSVDGPMEEFRLGLHEIYGGDIKKAVKAFFEVSSQMVEAGGFDFIGHFDKIYQHGRLWFNCKEEWYRKEVLDFLALVKQSGIPLELNTKSCMKHGIFYPHLSFLGTINELNIPLVLNSDTHDSHLTDLGFAVAIDALKHAGIKSLLVKNNTQWEEVGFSNKGMEVAECY